MAEGEVNRVVEASERHFPVHLGAIYYSLVGKKNENYLKKNLQFMLDQKN